MMSFIKKCYKCKIEKSSEEFYNRRSGKDGLQAICKLCSAKYRAENKERAKEHHEKWRAENKERIKERNAKYYAENKERHKESTAKWRAENKERRKETDAKWRTENKERVKETKAKWRAENKERVKENYAKWYAENKERRKESSAKYYIENKERVKETGAKRYLKNKERIKERNAKYYAENKERHKETKAKWFAKNKEKITKQFMQRYHNDLNFKLLNNLRGRVNKAIKRGSKSAKTMELLACSIEEFKSHLESKFTEGMTWDNHGEWHIDHIIPCASFDLTDPEQQKKCFHYTNMQPLWASENISKGARLEYQTK